MKGDFAIRKTNRKNGFTLVELIITCALIAVLATIALSQFTAYRQKGYNAAAVTDLGNVKLTLEAYFAEHQYYP